MRRHTRTAGYLGLVMLLGQPAPGPAQVIPPPPPTPVGQPPASPPTVRELMPLAHEMAEGVRRLGEDIAADMGQDPRARHLLEDTRELAQAIEEFHDALHDSDDPYQVGRSFTGLDSSWHHLRAGLTRSGASTPAVVRAAGRVEEIDARIHQVLSLAPLPDDYYSGEVAPDGASEARRLAYAMQNRAHDLVWAMRRDLEAADDPAARDRYDDAKRLAQATTRFYESFRPDMDPDAIRANFRRVARVADRLERSLQGPGLPPPVEETWQAFASSEVLLRRDLGMSVPPPTVPVEVVPAVGPSPLVALTDQLINELNTLLQGSGFAVGVVPEASQFIADMGRMRDEVIEFRRALDGGATPNQLAWEFRGVDATWRRLARRTDRIARGRSGPNIERIFAMGDALRQMHQLLGMPGYPPTFGPVGAVVGPGFER